MIYLFLLFTVPKYRGKTMKYTKNIVKSQKYISPKLRKTNTESRKNNQRKTGENNDLM